MKLVPYDHHVRVYRFVRNHEFQHMLHDWMEMLRREHYRLARQYDNYSRHVGAYRHHQMMSTFNAAQDYVINDILGPHLTQRSN